MKTTTNTALTAAATAYAAKLCAEQLAFLAAGRKTFVKGKPVMVAFDADKRAQLRRLAEGSFDGFSSIEKVYGLVDVVAEGATDEESAQAMIAEALAVYNAAGMAEVARCYGAE